MRPLGGTGGRSPDRFPWVAPRPRCTVESPGALKTLQAPLVLGDSEFINWGVGGGVSISLTLLVLIRHQGWGSL